MGKKAKEMNLYYMKQGQVSKEDIEDIMKRKKAKEREKRIKQNKMFLSSFTVKKRVTVRRK